MYNCCMQFYNVSVYYYVCTVSCKCFYAGELFVECVCCMFGNCFVVECCFVFG